MEAEKEKRELRSPDGTEPENGVGVGRELGEGVEVVALRATAAAGDAAAQQTIRARLGSCGVGHAS